jgi:tRNA-splicing ligase RtcB (3'-phosphate/5'-hydroxy nucleic acid ligase)
MNSRQLVKLGVPQNCVPQAIQAVQAIAKYNHSVAKESRINVEQYIADCIRGTLVFVDDNEQYPHMVALQKLRELFLEESSFVPPTPIAYRTWGNEIDAGSHAQMQQACGLPMAVGAALMPDAHVGYGLPIGGVLALDNAVCPFAVGVDIACRMRLSVYDMRPETLDKKNLFIEALERGTLFGVGVGYERGHQMNHPVMDEDWSITRVTKDCKTVAWQQLGTSGSGNHFAEFGILTVPEYVVNINLVGDDTGALHPVHPGRYIALMTHSGSRGAGSNVCKMFSGVAQAKLQKKYEYLGRLAWLDLDTQEGQEYWAAMELMGRYAAANHEIIHRNVSKLLGEKPIAFVENHHNFAWKEVHGGREVIVHRKGATPAGVGVLGVIPGSMATPGYIVAGLGNPESLNSASHGAGRCMSRKQAKDKYNWNATKKNLEAQGVTVLSAAADEVPGVYKDIEGVMDCQKDLVQKIAQFDPKIVKMCGDGSQAED